MTHTVHRLVRAFIVDQNKVLLCRSAIGKHQFYFLPGGHVDAGETDEQALLRELYEETGYAFEILSCIGDFEYNFIPEKVEKACHTHERNIIFSATSLSMTSDMPLVQQEDHIVLEWVSLDALDKIDLKPERLKTLIQH